MVTQACETVDPILINEILFYPLFLVQYNNFFKAHHSSILQRTLRDITQGSWFDDNRIFN